MLAQKNPQIISQSSNDVMECENIKIQHGQVALDYDAEMKQANEVSNTDAERKYCLPGGHWITVREERLKCPELLFAPTLVPNLGQDGIHKHTYDSIMKCD
jgi:hypothetical protein